MTDLASPKTAKKQKATTVAPYCPYCNDPARLTTGEEVYPHRPDLGAKKFWLCDQCGAYVGCHGTTDKPMGVPANAELRKARSILHEQMLDPLWKEADRTGLYRPEDDKARQMIRSAARGRVYRWLAAQMGLEQKNLHTGLFDLEQCRQAWRLLSKTSYPQIRDWAKAQKEAAQ